MKKSWLLCLIPSLLFGNNETTISAGAGVQESLLIDFRQSLFETKKQIFYGDLRGGIASTNGMYTPHSSDPFIEANVGLGFRQLREKNALGVYSFYGKLKSPYHNYFSRVALGFEYLSAPFGGFFNFFCPVGKKVHSLDHYGFSTFQFKLFEHKVQFKEFKYTEVISPFIFEAGIKKTIGKVQAQLRGDYHVRSSKTKARGGGSLQLLKDINSHFSMNLNLGYDSFYEAIAQVGVQYSFGKGRKKGEPSNFYPLTPVYLEEFFWTQRTTKKVYDQVVKDNVFYVNSSLIYPIGYLGDGTYENPFQTASQANAVINTYPDATLYFYQGEGPYTGFSTYNLRGTQWITGEGGDWNFLGVTLIPGNGALRPTLARNALQESMDIPIIDLVDSAHTTIENIALKNSSGDKATGGSMLITTSGLIPSTTLNNLVSEEKVSLFLMSGNSNINVSKCDIYGLDIKTFVASSANVKIANNTFRTNRMVARAFNQQINADLFLESLNASTFYVNQLEFNQAYNTTLNGHAQLNIGLLGSGTSILNVNQGMYSNQCFGMLPSSNAGAFLFQGAGSARPYINGCVNNSSDPTTSGFTIAFSDVNIKKPGVPPTDVGLRSVNESEVYLFSGAVILNTEE